MRVFGVEYAQPKHYLRGTHRTRSPADTVAEYSKLMGPMGITRLANITGLDNIGLPVYVAVRPNSRCIAVSQGKGADKDSAKASALMESIEGWHAERIEKPRWFASYETLSKTERVANWEDLPFGWGRSQRPDVPLQWIEGYDLMSNQSVLVPELLATLDHVPIIPDAPFLPSSNGLASGNHLLEAIVHGICELIERDALALWSDDEDDEEEDSSKATQIDLATIDDPGALATLSQVTKANVGVAIWDITSDTAIPTYVCSIFDQPGHGAKGIASGFGCHLSPTVALMRALTEAIQGRLTVISGSRDDVPVEVFERIKDGLVAFRAAIADPPAPLSFNSRTSLATPTFEEDIEILLDALARIDIKQVIVVDLSRSDIGIPVVKVIIPGLEGLQQPDYLRCAPGKRLTARMNRNR